MLVTRPWPRLTEHYDVAIVGGGPAGSTAATLLKKYAPELRVLVLEKEIFPARPHRRKHVAANLSGPG